MNKIAVITGIDGLISTFFEAGHIKVYQKNPEQWECEKEVPVNIPEKNNMGSVRQNIAAIAESLRDCNIIMGREISGIPYNILSKAGFSIFEAEGRPYNYLDGVYKMYLESQSSANHSAESPETPIQPLQTDIEGNYRLNLIEAQTLRPSVSSKKMLLPFLRSTPFYQLEVICSHIPPWFEVELLNLGLKWSSSRLAANEFMVTICHKTCSEK